MKYEKVRLFRLCVMVVLAIGAISAAQLRAAEFVIKSDASNIGASLTTSGEYPSLAQEALLTSGTTTGLIFSPVGTDDTGSFTPVPASAPLGTIQVQIPPECSYWCGQSGFVETTFTLPTTFSDALLTGEANVDDWGYVFLNGHLISSELFEFGDTAFETTVQSFFQSGVNTFVISDFNTGGPSGVAFYADITYTTTATPEPSSLWLLGSGLAGLAGLARRKITLRA